MVSEEASAAIMALISTDVTRTLVPIDWLELDVDRKQTLFLGAAEDLKEAPKFGDDERDFGRYYDYWEDRESDWVTEEEEDAMIVVHLTPTPLC